MQMLNVSRSKVGCTLMTMHKCKGKEFDAIIIYDGLRPPHRIVRHDDTPPYEKSRRLFRVGVSRARKYVYILTPASDPCPLIPGSK